MRILHVTQGYAPAIGGTELVIQRASEELVKTFGDDVTVFTTNCYNGEGFFKPELPRLPVGWLVINGVHVRRFPVRSRVSQLLGIPQFLAYHARLPYNDHLRTLARGPLIPGLAEAIRDFPADIIAASSFPLWHMFATLRAARQSGRPCILIGGLHPMDEWGYNRPMIYRAIQRASQYIAYTKFEADYVIGRGASPERITVIGAGVDPERFEQVSSDDAKQRLGLQGKPVVGFIGQLGGHKGVDTLVRAMPIIWESLPDAHILIAGGRTLFCDYLESLIARWSDTDRKKLTLLYNFPEDDKPWLFAATDVFAYPSGFESFGISYLEAWACGKPVIGCDRGAVPWVIHAGRDGLLVEYQDVTMLAEAVVVLLRNPLWAEELGRAGREKTLEHYTWREIARRFRKVYVQAMEESRVRAKDEIVRN